MNITPYLENIQRSIDEMKRIITGDATQDHLAALKKAEAEGKTIQWDCEGSWQDLSLGTKDPLLETLPLSRLRVKPEEWKLTRQIPGFRELAEGEEWHFEHRWKQEHLPAGKRPLLVGEPEQIGDEYLIGKWETNTPRHAIVKPHDMDNQRRTSRPLPLLTPAQVAEGWIEWKGGENPVPRKKVSLILQDGGSGCINEPSEGLVWEHLDDDHCGKGSNITAYRVIEPAKPATRTVELGPEDVRCGDEVRLRVSGYPLLVQMVRHDGIDVFSKGFRDWDALREHFEIRRRNSDTFEPCSKEVAV